jgi:hypothetical protein
MSRKSLGRKAALLVLGAALVAPWSAAAAGRSRAEPRHERTIAAAPRGVIALLWGALTSIWEENGCSLDPSGLTGACQHGLTTPTGQEGCSLDPSGVSCGRATFLTGVVEAGGCSPGSNGRCSK